tara:strand:+ start:117 stop:908 length:792 start_codon:yes stop_codon:yes gene_type:complete
MTNPDERMDPWQEALDCYKFFSDEVVIVGEDWPYEFKWDYIGKVFQEGFDKAKGDWVINMPTDMFFHENDKEKLITSLKDNDDAPGVVFPKLKFFNYNRCEFKTFDAMAINKKNFSEVKFNGGGDLCLPTLNSIVLDQNNLPIVDVPLWNYDTTFRTKEIIAEDRARFARAWFSEFMKWDDRGGETTKLAYEAWIEMVKTRLPKHTINKNLEDHPRFIQNSLANLKSDQFGYSCFGLIDEYKPRFIDYFNLVKTKIKYPMINI